MKRATLVVLAAGLALVQGFFLSALGGGRIIPNIILILLLAVAAHRSTKLALVLAIWAGFWLDVASNLYFGIHMLLFSLFILGIGLLLRGGIEFDRRFTNLLILLGAAYLYNMVFLVLLWISSRHVSWSWQMFGQWSLGVGIMLVIAWLVGRRLRESVSRKQVYSG